MKKYYKDYRLIPKKSSNGRVTQVTEYIGKYYICQLDEKSLRKFKFYFFALVLCSDTAAISIGFLNNPGSRVIYVALPYVSLFLPMFFSLLGTFKFITAGNKLEQAAYDKTKIRIHRSTVWQIVLSGMALAGDILYIITENDKDLLNEEWAFASGILLMLVFNIIFINLQKKVTYIAEEQNCN